MSNQLTPRDERILEALKTLGPSLVNELVEWTGSVTATVHYRLEILHGHGLVHKFTVKRDAPGRPCIYWFSRETGDDIFLNWCKKLETESFNHFIKRLHSLPPVLETRLVSLLVRKIETFLLSEMGAGHSAIILSKDQLNEFTSLSFLKQVTNNPVKGAEKNNDPC
ncbi:MAG: hypothetical protein ACFFD4_12900 [Candidatus Odinarchaeota archaeon]